MQMQDIMVVGKKISNLISRQQRPKLKNASDLTELISRRCAHVPMEVLPFGGVAWAWRVRVHHHERVECPAVAASAAGGGDAHRRLGRHLRRPQLRPAGHLAAAVEHPEQRRRGEVVHDVADDVADHERVPPHAHRRRPSLWSGHLLPKDQDTLLHKAC